MDTIKSQLERRKKKNSMKNENICLLNKMINQKTNELGITMIKPKHSGIVVSILREDWHLFAEIQCSVAPSLSLQMTIYVEDDTIRMLFFPSPCIIHNNNINQFLYLSNTANQYLFRGNALGRFWVDEKNLDFSYELIIKEELLEYCTEEVARQLFDIPIAHYADLHIPLIMLAKNEWGAETAVKYLTELREKGYVVNKDYNLW